MNNIQKLKVGNKLYEGEYVPDGFYDSISSLKKVDDLALANSPSFASASLMYNNILKICRTKSKVPPVSHQMASEILKTI